MLRLQLIQRYRLTIPTPNRCLLVCLGLLATLSCGTQGAKASHRARALSSSTKNETGRTLDIEPRREKTTTTLSYRLQPDFNHSPSRLHVTLSIHLNPGDLNKLDNKITLHMPAWSPGDYHLQHHGRYVQDLTARADSRNTTMALNVAHPDEDTWVIAAVDTGTIEIDYALPTTPPGIFSDNIKVDPHFLFLNGPAAYLYPADLSLKNPITLGVNLPGPWTVATALPRRVSNNVSEGNLTLFSAPDYDTLADSPVVMGDRTALTSVDCEVNQVPIQAVFFRQAAAIAQPKSYLPIVQQIVKAEADIMGGLPIKRYLFLFDVGGGGGALEHLNSTRIPIWPGSPPQALIRFVSHEFFHLWNVKRIRPRALGPFDYIHPPHTRNIWFAEGVTEYYANIAARRAGLTSVTQFHEHWRRAIASMQRNPARLKVSADEVSLRIWESGDSEEFGGLSYYDKGELIGLCMDLKLRAITHGKRSLDDMVRLLMKRHAPPQPGYEEDELRSTLSEVAGQDISTFYDELARSTKEMPFAACLNYVGLGLDLQPLPHATPAQVALRSAWETSH